MLSKIRNWGLWLGLAVFPAAILLLPTGTSAAYPTFSAADAATLDKESGFGENIMRLQFFARTRAQLVALEALSLTGMTSTTGASWSINYGEIGRAHV